MVARVALVADSIVIVDSTNVLISDLRFKGNSGIDSGVDGGKDTMEHPSRESEEETV